MRNRVPRLHFHELLSFAKNKSIIVDKAFSVNETFSLFYLIGGSLFTISPAGCFTGQLKLERRSGLLGLHLGFSGIYFLLLEITSTSLGMLKCTELFSSSRNSLANLSTRCFAGYS